MYVLLLGNLNFLEMLPVRVVTMYVLHVLLLLVTVKHVQIPIDQKLIIQFVVVMINGLIKVQVIKFVLNVRHSVLNV